MSRSALVNDGFLAFVVLLVLLVLLLAMSFVAVIRVPRWAGSPSDQDTQDEPGHFVPSHAGPAQGGARPPGTQAGAPRPVPRASPASRTIRPGTSPARCLG